MIVFKLLNMFRQSKGVLREAGSLSSNNPSRPIKPQLTEPGKTADLQGAGPHESAKHPEDCEPHFLCQKRYVCNSSGMKEKPFFFFKVRHTVVGWP